MQKYFLWNEEKNEWLYETRWFRFEDIFEWEIIDIIQNESSHYTHQKVFIVRLHDSIYMVPFIEEKEYIFLKTMYKSRKYNKRYNS